MTFVGAAARPPPPSSHHHQHRCCKLCPHPAEGRRSPQKQESKVFSPLLSIPGSFFLSSAQKKKRKENKKSSLPPSVSPPLPADSCLSLSLPLFDRRPIQECAPTFTIGTLWLARRRNTAGCGHISSVRTHRRTWMAGSGPWTRRRWCSRLTL